MNWASDESSDAGACARRATTDCFVALEVQERPFNTAGLVRVNVRGLFGTLLFEGRAAGLLRGSGGGESRQEHCRQGVPS
jgi:hypothetical protein